MMLRSIYFMQGFDKFGPMIWIIQEMFADISTFIVIWILILLMFSSMATLLLYRLELDNEENEIKHYDNVWSACLYFF